MSIVLENISCPVRFKIKIHCPIWEILVFPMNNYYLKMSASNLLFKTRCCKTGESPNRQLAKALSCSVLRNPFYLILKQFLQYCIQNTIITITKVIHNMYVLYCSIKYIF